MLNVIAFLLPLAFAGGAANSAALTQNQFCGELRNGASIEASVTTSERRGRKSYRSQLFVDGEELRNVGSCFVSDRPSTRYVKCAHENDQFRVEFYTRIQTPAGRLRRSGAVVWRGNHPEEVLLRRCH